MVDYSIRPNESRASDENVNIPGWSPLTQSQFSQQSEPIQADIRGLKLAQLKQQKKIEEEKLTQISIQLGTEKTKTKQKREQFKAEIFKLITERAKAAKAQDASVFETKSWETEQGAVRTRLESLRLKKFNEDETLDNDRRAAVATFN